MKKTFLLLLSVLMVFSFVACSQPAMSEQDILDAAKKLLEEQEAKQTKEAPDIDVDNEEDDLNNSASGEVEREPEVDTAELAKNVALEMYPLRDGQVLFKFTNNNDSQIATMEATVTFYDDEQKLLKKYNGFFNAIEAGMDVYGLSYDLNDVEVDLTNYKTKFDVQDSDFYKNASADINIEANLSGDKIMAEVSNNGKSEISSLSVIALYYIDDELVGANTALAYDLGAGDFDVLEFWPPYGKSYKTLKYDRYTLIVNEAYTNNW